MKYVLPDWIDDFVCNQILKDIEKKDEGERKRTLYGLGRLSLEEVQPFVRAGIPKQDEEGRYLTTNPVQGFPDELMRDIHTANLIQEKLSSIVRKRPERPFTFVPVWTPGQVEERIRARDWAQSVWGAGSHTSCDINILHMNVQMGIEEYGPALEAAMSVCAAYQSPIDGMWGLSENEPYGRVNGTMKVLSRVYFIQECYLPFADKIIDYVLYYSNGILSELMSQHATHTMLCNLIDVLFCLEYTVKMTGHRSNEISETAYSLFPMLDELRHREDFNLGLLQGSIRRAANLCGLKDELGWPEKVYRFPRNQ